MNKKQFAMIVMVLNGKNINVSLILISFVCDPIPFFVMDCDCDCDYTVVHN